MRALSLGCIWSQDQSRDAANMTEYSNEFLNDEPVDFSGQHVVHG